MKDQSLPRTVDIPSMDRPQAPGQTDMRWGSDAVAAMLRALGLQYVTLNPGASYRGLHDSIVNYLGNESPHMLVCLHEEHAVAMAHGYGKVTGRPMGVILHSNVGLMHAAMAIFNAWCDRVPMVIVGATGAVDAARRRPWIEWIHTMKDQGGLVRPYLKWDDQPASIPAALESLMRAHQLATTSPAGPTYVVLDVSLQEDPLETVPAIPEIERFTPAPAPLPDPESMDKAAALLLSARRPLIMMGRVSRGQAAWDDRVRLAELLDARVLTDFKQGAAFPTAHPLHEGVPAFRLDEQGMSVLREADVVLSLDWVDLAGTLKAVWGDGTVPAKIVHCSLDSYSHGGAGMEYMGLPPVDLPMLCGADALVSLILPRLQARKGAAAPGEASRAKEAAQADSGAAAPAQGRNGGLRTADIARALRAATLGKDICLVRLPFGWNTSDFPLEGPLDYLGYDGGAGLGSGPGMAVGGSLGLLGSGRMPIAVLGDGDFLMSVTALWTASHYELPLLIVVANNHCYNNDVAHQERVALRRERPVENKFIGQSIDGPPVDLTAMARAQGFGGAAPVTRLEELAPALENAVAEVEKGGRCLVDVHIIAE